MKVSWIRDLGSPTQPSVYEVRGVEVEITALDIRRAKAELASGRSDVIFNLLPSNYRGKRRYILGTIAVD
jgi:hypothetical protein